MTSWRTTIGGVLAALGSALQLLDGPTWARPIGLVLATLGVALLGVAARDSKVTSEEAGAKEPMHELVATEGKPQAGVRPLERGEAIGVREDDAVDLGGFANPRPGQAPNIEPEKRP